MTICFADVYEPTSLISHFCLMLIDGHKLPGLVSDISSVTKSKKVRLRSVAMVMMVSVLASSRSSASS